MHANTSNRARAAVIGLIALLLAASCALALNAGQADAVNAKVIGKTPKTPKPSCPTPSGDSVPSYKQCQGIGEVTAVQKRADGVRNPYKVPQNGTIVGWSISLGNPTAAEYKFFTEMPAGGPALPSGNNPGGVGWGPPSARISVLKKKKHKRFKLVKQSPAVELKSKLGSNPIITLGKPMKVKAGLFIGLTTPTWHSAFAHDAPVTSSKGDVWLASRGEKHCGKVPGNATQDEANAIILDMVKHSKPQQKQGSTRSYKCSYGKGRNIFSAFFVPKK